MKQRSKYLSLLALLLALTLLFVGCDTGAGGDTTTAAQTTAATTLAPPSASGLDDIPPYADSPYVTVGDGVPDFTAEELSRAHTSFEEYSELDALGRCGVAFASCGIDLMPQEDRGSIGMVKPSGWHTVKYDIVNGKYLYNRCHLIGFQLTAENANEKNLITGTRYLNVVGMLPFEDDIADYVKDTGNHVLYRVTPVFRGENLLADGVLLEALSVEDHGAGISFSVFVYNVQPGIVIDYATGESYLASEPPATSAPTTTAAPSNEEQNEPILTYIVNSNTMKFHKEDCRYASSISEGNRDVYVQRRSYLIRMGFDPCGTCKP